ncbi:hypothetical protein NDK47_10925 [Brevibacillus ruminantium]|uniref:Flagellar hook-length control protein FliK n=1 Tax=Brevibacillus ruminantium TaxID=2950604 RepID=A0ABY4WT25_9BACL|nr:hypothetical protein [Brevibacillus ruminantium]USG67751.1 hypothetical protein NDK47_10925 [Brevibacillus ruminantium]
MFSPAQMVQSLMQRSHISTAKPVEFTPGQVFTGAIVRTYPENMALVQIGGMQLQAKLEASLEAGQRAWLQVQPSSGVVTLKVLQSSQGGAVAEASLEGLMKSLGITDTKENKAIVQALVSANQPVNREMTQSFAAVTQRLGGDQGTVDAFLLALKRNLPITPESIAGIKAFLSEKPLSQTIQAFLRQADEWWDKGSESGKANSNGSAAPSTMSGNSGQSQATDPQGTQLRAIIGALRESLGNLAVSLPREELSQAGTSGASVMQNSTPGLGGPGFGAGAASAAAATTFGKAGAEAMQKEITAHPATTGNSDAARQSEMSGQRPGGTSEPYLGGLEKGNKSALAGKATGVKLDDLQATQSRSAEMSASSDSLQQNQSASAARINHPILEMFRQLGLSHEREVANQVMAGGQDAIKQLESVKSLLLQLSSGSLGGVPAGLRDAADVLLQQITGQQLMLAQSTHQPLAQVVMQIPIRTQDGEDTAYVQIESRKKGGGELDPENCRLFFHLDLSAMGTTMLDVSIVNRIVNIQVFNNSNWVEPLVQNMRDSLVDQLQGVGYQLSSMRVQSIPEAKGSVQRLGASSGYMMNDYKGVDFRV